MKRIVLCFLFFGVITAQAQSPKKWTATDIYEAIEKLNFLGAALYVAAHPDDENTALIAYLANEVKANTAYLSLTRGDGGQNLIGTEIRELLGLIRNYELLEARKIDGGMQFFSRANDFGFSKQPDETFQIWDKQQVLSDMIWVIRQFQPDVIINRFDHRTPGTTHGHHTAASILAMEAFDLCNAPSAFPEQLKYVQPWQPKRIFFNTSWFFYGSREAFEKADKSNLSSNNVGVYYPLKGKSNTEIAAASRTMHKSQGFGSTAVRGESLDYLELVKGDAVEQNNIFHGINTTWTRLDGGAPIGEILSVILKEFNFNAPANSTPFLLLAYKMMQTLPDSYWKQVKIKELEEILAAIHGMYLEAVANNFSATPGDEVQLNIEAIQRAGSKVILKSLTFLPTGKDTLLNIVLEQNKVNEFKQKLTLPKDIAYTNPYWLNEDWELGMYKVDNQLLRSSPETPRAFQVQFNIEIDGVPLVYIRNVLFKRNDPVNGEVYRPFEITPPVFANLAQKVYVFSDNQSQEIEVVVRAGKANIQGTVQLEAPNNWKVEPESILFDLPLQEQEFKAVFSITPPPNADEGFVKPKVNLGGKTYDREVVFINYDHIPAQTVLRKAKAKVVKVDIKKVGNKIAYFMGAGDEVPNSLAQVGYHLTLLEDKDISLVNLQNFDALVVGVRAYNTNDRIKFHQAIFMEYVNQGGTMIVQYNTNGGLKIAPDKIGPYPFSISRERVTVEEAEIRFLVPEHPILNFPNKITAQDFEGWQQERGLYFANKWDSNYAAILSSNDPNETPQDGGLLVAKYGKGYFIYTGYAWFRQLPAGVPGAFRLFANMLAVKASEIDKAATETQQKEKKQAKKDSKGQ
jgi:LmbE family N-acetylglucosaminyl deacetylase